MFKKQMTLQQRFFLAETIDLLEELKKEPGFDVNIKGANGNTALFTASLGKTKWLIANGCDINFINKKNQNALFKLKVKDFEKLKVLIKNGINIEQEDIYGCNFLHNLNNVIIDKLANTENEINISKLINKKAKSEKETPLLYNHLKKNIEDVKNLIKLGANPNLRTYSGENALHIYCSNYEVFKYLIENIKFKNLDKMLNDGTYSRKPVADNLLYILADLLRAATKEDKEIEKEKIYLLKKYYPKETEKMLSDIFDNYSSLDKHVIMELRELKALTEKEELMNSLEGINNHSYKHTKKRI